MGDLCNKSFDEQFRKIDGLTWLPWVGKDYEKSERRILLIAESHYVKDDSENIEKAKQEWLNDETSTRQCVQECPIEKWWHNNMYANLHKALFLEDDFNAEKLWSHISFYDFVQRPMDYTIQERPVEKDFLSGWEVFCKVIDIIKPTDCIFIGVKASDTFVYSMNQLKIEHSDIEYEKIDDVKTYGRTFSMPKGNQNILMAAIQHTSSFFSPPVWHDSLLKTMPKAMDFIRKCAK